MVRMMTTTTMRMTTNCQVPCTAPGTVIAVATGVGDVGLGEAEEIGVGVWLGLVVDVVEGINRNPAASVSFTEAVPLA